MNSLSRRVRLAARDLLWGPRVVSVGITGRSSMDSLVVPGHEIAVPTSPGSGASSIARYSERRAYMLHNVRVQPALGLVFAGRRTLIRESVFSEPRLRRTLQSFHGWVSRDSGTPLAGISTAVDCWPWENYYHWFVDVLPRVLALHREPFVSLPRITLLSRELPAEWEPVLRQMLPPNVEMRWIERGAVFRPERFILLPYLSGDCDGYLPPAYLARFHAAVEELFGLELHGRRTKRILVSRSQAQKRRLINEDELLEALRPLDFERHVLEALSLREQVTLFARAELVVAPHGAGLTNLLYAPGARGVVEIFATRTSQHLRHYRMLAAALGIPYTAIRRNEEQKDHDVHVDPDEVVARVQAAG
jgi:hypothetical protein